jgi:hypothetical protein
LFILIIIGILIYIIFHLWLGYEDLQEHKKIVIFINFKYKIVYNGRIKKEI